MVAAPDGTNRPQSILGERDAGRADFTIRLKARETWLLVNEGTDVAYLVGIEGLTDLDKRRLIEVAAEPASLGEGQAKSFVLVSRLMLSGPAYAVVL